MVLITTSLTGRIPYESCPKWLKSQYLTLYIFIPRTNVNHYLSTNVELMHSVHVIRTSTLAAAIITRALADREESLEDPDPDPDPGRYYDRRSRSF